MEARKSEVAVVELARALIRRPSVTPDDHGCQQLIAERLEKMGFKIEALRFGDVDNLWARRGKPAPVLCFAGHTDVVPPGPLEQWRVDPFAAEIRDGKLVARGAADMKASLAAMISACGRFVTDYPDHRGSLAFLITSDEEGAAQDGTLKVMQTLTQRGESIDWCVVGEPSSTDVLGDTVRIGRRGSLSGLMTIRGAQTHVAYPLPAGNPMHGLAQFIAAVTREPLDEGNAQFPPTTFQMVNVHSDADAPNVVPADLRCRFNFRYSTRWTHETLSAHVEAMLAKLGLDYEIEWRVAGEPFLTEEGRLSAAVCTAVKEQTGLDPELSTSGGTSDGRFIAPYGVDVLEVGPVNKTIHQANEEIDVADISRLEKIYYRIAELLLASTN
ncbi:MAG: succinyl-diaminopimelate desuccinylase [Gammaproteobacteria bacterium]|nr:MAG: succinyl-diaminopimelate desuccinylase [Gammaproteobacteria bacterium]